jgi:enhancer of polycomb-like protein
MNDMDAFRKMKQLRLDFEKVRALLDLVRKREALHRMVILAGEECFEQQLYDLVDTSGLPRVSNVLKRDAMDELIRSPVHLDAISGAMSASDKRRRAENEYAKRTATPVSSSATSDTPTASSGPAPALVVAGQNYGEPAPLFLHPLKTRESFVSESAYCSTLH